MWDSKHRETGPEKETAVEREAGQTTAEYALVLLVAALVVGVFAAFVRSGALMEMFQTILSGLVERAG